MLALKRRLPHPLLLSVIPAAAIPFFVTIRASPEIIVPAYFMTRGSLLYQEIFFPHTPMLLSAVAGLGSVFGFSAILFRSIVSVGMAATVVLVVLGLERGAGFALAAATGVLSCVLWTGYMEAFGIWPDAQLAPVLLGAALLLERFDRSDSRASLLGGGLLLGLAVLVKQTSAWVGAAALLWTVLRRKRFREIATLAAAIAAPYLLFVIVWGAVFRTTTHVYWTLILPVFSRHAGEILSAAGWDDLHESITLFLALFSVLLLERSLGSRSRSPLFPMTLGTIPMAWPRSGLLHLSSCIGLVSLLAARAVLLSVSVFRRWSREGLPILRLAPAVAGVSALVTGLAVAAVGGGALLRDSWGGNAYYWDDARTTYFLKQVSARVPPGGRVYLFNTGRDNVYVRSSTVTPDGLYVNSSLWHYLNKLDVDLRLVKGLERFSGWILFRDVEPGETRLESTALSQFLISHTVEVEKLGDGVSWRKVRRR
jgi:hypothetical protein